MSISTQDSTSTAQTGTSIDIPSRDAAARPTQDGTRRLSPLTTVPMRMAGVGEEEQQPSQDEEVQGEAESKAADEYEEAEKAHRYWALKKVNLLRGTKELPLLPDSETNRSLAKSWMELKPERFHTDAEIAAAAAKEKAESAKASARAAFRTCESNRRNIMQAVP